MRSGFRHLVIVASVYSGFLISSCNFKKEDNTASLSIAVNFPAKKLSVKYLRPETQCIEVFLKSKDENFSKTVILTPQNNSVTIKNLKPQTILISARLTDGPQSVDGCTGFELDYISAIVKVEPGINTANLPLPGAQWSLGQSISLNGTLNSSQESINSFVILQHPKSLKSGAFDFYTLYIRGQNLNNCNSGTGVACSVKTQFSVAGQGKSSRAILGNEFVPFPDYQYGFIPLSPDASNNERYFAIVGVPPCTYFKNQDLVKCSFTSSTDLTQYMGAELSDNVLNGYIWEVRVLTKSSGVRCAWDQNFAQTFNCPSSLTEPPPQPGSASPQVKSGGSPKLKTAQLIQNISSTLERVYKLQSLNYASCDPNNPEVCDYNLNGTIGDAGDDTNGDGVINLSDNRTFYSEFSWSMTFDLFPHPFSSSPGYPQTMVNTAFPIYNVPDIATSSSNAIFLRDLINNATISTIGDPTNTTIAMDMEGIIWQYGTFDFSTLYYYGLHPRYLFYRESLGIFRKVDLYNPTAPPVDLYRSSDISTYGFICGAEVLSDPIAGKAYFFVHTSGTGTCLSPATPAYLIIDSENQIVGNHNFYDSANGLIVAPAIYSDSNLRAIDGVYGPNFSSNTIERYDFTGTPPINPTPVTLVSTKLSTLSPSTFYSVGFSFTNRYSFFVVGDGISSYLFYSTPADRNTVYAEQTETPVDFCTLLSDTAYCTFTDASGNLTGYRFDFASGKLIQIGTVNVGTGWTPDHLAGTGNYFIVRLIDSTFTSYKYYAFPKIGGTPILMNDPTNGGDIFFEYATDSLALGKDINNRLCYVFDADIQNIKCVQNSYFPTNAGMVSGFVAPAVTYMSNGTFSRYVATKWLPVSEGCTPVTEGCTGGTLYLYSIDFQKKLKIDPPIPSGFQPEQMLGIDDLILIKLVNKASGQSEIFLVNARTQTMQTTNISALNPSEVNIVGEYPRFILPP